MSTKSYWILFGVVRCSYVRQVGLIYPLVWFPARFWGMLILTGLRLAWSGLCEQRKEGHVLGGGLSKIYSQNEFGRMSSAYLPILSILFNTICQKAIISSLPRCLKKPLETLWVMRCYLSQSEVDYQPYCLNIFELKCLHLIDIPLCYLLLQPLGCLLELGIPWNACIWSHVEWGNLSSMPCCLL